MGGAALSAYELQVLVYTMQEFVGHDRHNLKLQIVTVASCDQLDPCIDVIIT